MNISLRGDQYGGPTNLRVIVLQTAGDLFDVFGNLLPNLSRQLPVDAGNVLVLANTTTDPSGSTGGCGTPASFSLATVFRANQQSPWQCVERLPSASSDSVANDTSSVSSSPRRSFPTYAFNAHDAVVRHEANIIRSVQEHICSKNLTQGSAVTRVLDTSQYPLGSGGALNLDGADPAAGSGVVANSESTRAAAAPSDPVSFQIPPQLGSVFESLAEMSKNISMQTTLMMEMREFVSSASKSSSNGKQRPPRQRGGGRKKKPPSSGKKPPSSGKNASKKLKRRQGGHGQGQGGRGQGQGGRGRGTGGRGQRQGHGGVVGEFSPSL